MNAQLALQLAKQFSDYSTPVTAEEWFVIVAMSLVGIVCLIMPAVNDDLSRCSQ